MIYVKKLLDDDYPYWVLFKQGELQSPLALLSDAEMQSIVKTVLAEKEAK